LAWTVEWDERAIKEANKLALESRRRIQGFLRDRIATDDNPRRLGKPLVAGKAGLWRYRVGDYRIICRIEDDRVVVLVVAVGHRSKVYG
jgi:mRNA interferase RelE/StbE